VGTLPYQQNAFGQIAAGLGMAVKEWRAQQELEKQKAMTDLQNALAFSQNTGIGQDPKKIKKLMDKAGLPVDWEGFSSQQYQQTMQQQAGQPQAAPQGAQGLPAMPPMAAQLGGPGQAPVSMQPQGMPPFAGAVADVSTPQAMQGGGMGEYMRATGASFPPAAPPPQGGLEGFLSQLAAGARTKQEQERAAQQIEMRKQKLMGAAIGENPKERQQALTILYATGMMKGPEGYAALITAASEKYGPEQAASRVAEVYLDQAMGGPQARAAKMQAQVELLKMDAELRRKAADMVVQFMDRIPGAPPEAVEAKVMGLLTGDIQMEQAADQVLRNLPTKALLEEGRARRKEGREDKALELDDARYQELVRHNKKLEQNASASLGLQREQMTQQQTQHERQMLMESARLQNSVISGLQGVLGQDAEMWMKAATAKDVDPETKKLALQRIADAKNKLGTLEYVVPDGSGGMVRKTFPVSRMTVEELKDWWDFLPFTRTDYRLRGAEGTTVNYGTQRQGSNLPTPQINPQSGGIGSLLQGMTRGTPVPRPPLPPTI
jgi:hypothetical protein